MMSVIMNLFQRNLYSGEMIMLRNFLVWVHIWNVRRYNEDNVYNFKYFINIFKCLFCINKECLFFHSYKRILLKYVCNVDEVVHANSSSNLKICQLYMNYQLCTVLCFTLTWIKVSNLDLMGLILTLESLSNESLQVSHPMIQIFTNMYYNTSIYPL